MIDLDMNSATDSVQPSLFFLFFPLSLSLFIQVCSSPHIEMICYARLVSTKSQLWSQGK